MQESTIVYPRVILYLYYFAKISKAGQIKLQGCAEGQNWILPIFHSKRLLEQPDEFTLPTFFWLPFVHPIVSNRMLRILNVYRRERHLIRDRVKMQWIFSKWLFCKDSRLTFPILWVMRNWPKRKRKNFSNKINVSIILL